MDEDKGKQQQISKKITDNTELGEEAIFLGLAECYKQKGEWDKAIQYYNKTLEIRSKVISPIPIIVRQDGLNQQTELYKSPVIINLNQ